MTQQAQPLSEEELARLTADAYASQWRLLPLLTAQCLLATIVQRDEVIATLKVQIAELQSQVKKPSREKMCGVIYRSMVDGKYEGKITDALQIAQETTDAVLALLAQTNGGKL